MKTEYKLNLNELIFTSLLFFSVGYWWFYFVNILKIGFWNFIIIIIVAILMKLYFDTKEIKK